MTLNEFQSAAMTTCMDSSKNIAYMLHNLQGEVGEFASKVAKKIRKSKTIAISTNRVDKYGNRIISEGYTFTMNPEEESDLEKEAGDIMWQIAGLCSVMGWKLENVCQQNLDKLASRQERNVIDGNGDNR